MTMIQQMSDTQFKSYTLREWRCGCGGRWQLLLSPKYPDREVWQPTCDCQVRIVIGKTYSHPSRPNTVFLASKTKSGGVVLRDLNRSREWSPPGRKGVEGYFEGYAVDEGRLRLVRFNIERGKWVEEEGLSEYLRLESIRPCEVEEEVIDLSQFGVIHQ